MSTMGLQDLLEKVHRDRQLDFRQYRQGTLTRRLRRRLKATRSGTYAGYARALDSDPDEYDRLANELAIHVTGFFRDQAAFRALREIVPASLVANGTKDVGIWCAGCAMGEEPYSVATLVLEVCREQDANKGLQILATDIDGRALHQAREGLLPRKAAQQIAPALLERYLVPEGASPRIGPPIVGDSRSATASQQPVSRSRHGPGNRPENHQASPGPDLGGITAWGGQRVSLRYPTRG